MDKDFLPAHLALAESVVAIFPAATVERTNDLVQMDLGPREEGTVLLLFLPDALEVRFRVVEWRSSHCPVLNSRLLKRFKYARLDRGRLLGLVTDAKVEWADRLRECSWC